MKHLLVKHRRYFQYGEPSKNISAPLEPVLLNRIDFSSDIGFKVSLGNVHIFGLSSGLTENRLQIRSAMWLTFIYDLCLIVNIENGTYVR